MALSNRGARGGTGHVIDLNFLEPIWYGQLSVVQTRTGNPSGDNAPRNTYLTADGKWVAISTSATAIAEGTTRLVGPAR